MNKKIKISSFDMINNAVVFIVAAITLYPFLYVIAVSLSSNQAIMQNIVSIFPVGLNLKAYESVLKNDWIVPAYMNTLLYTASGTAINVVMTILAAYPISRNDFQARKPFTFLVVFTMFFAGGMIPNYLLIKELKMINTIWAIILPGAVQTYLLIITRSFFMQMPISITESAKIEGANDLQILKKIVLPLSLPCIATISLFYAVGNWNNYFGPLIYLNDKAKYPVQIFLRQVVISGEMALQNTSISIEEVVVSESLKGATIIVATVPILVVYPFVQKYFVKGAMIGSVKG